MSISNELSGDIAAAILSTGIGSPEKLEALKETVLIVHPFYKEIGSRFKR